MEYQSFRDIKKMPALCMVMILSNFCLFFPYRFNKGLWRKNIPKGLKLKKFIEGPDGNLVHDSSYVGEHAWEDDSGGPEDNIKEIIDREVEMNSETKEALKEDIGISGIWICNGFL